MILGEEHPEHQRANGYDRGEDDEGVAAGGFVVEEVAWLLSVLLLRHRLMKVGGGSLSEWVGDLTWLSEVDHHLKTVLQSLAKIAAVPVMRMRRPQLFPNASARSPIVGSKSVGICCWVSQDPVRD